MHNHKNLTQLFLSLLLSCAVLAVAPAYAKAPTTQFMPEQVKQIQGIVHNYLVDNPRVLMEAMQNLRQQAINQAKMQLQQEAEQHKSEIFNLKGRPILGNPQGTVTAVQFFDSQCSACKATAPGLEKLIKDHANLKVVFIDWPFFGQVSVYVAKLGLAAINQNKYAELHRAFMSAPNALTQDQALKFVEQAGLDKAKLLEDVKANDAKYSKIIQDNFALASKLKLEGTPTFIFANKDLSKISVYPGGGREADLKKAMDEVGR